MTFSAGRAPRPFHQGASTIDPEAASWWNAEKERYLATGALEHAIDQRYVSRAFVVPKASGGWRLVVDLRPLNKHCAPRPCRYDTLKTFRGMARRGDVMASFDLKDGYHHLAIREEDRKYFTFVMNGEVFRCAALPFGWNHSPAIFTELMRVMVKHLRKRGTRVLPYLDDFLLCWATQAEAEQGVREVQALLQRLGLSWHPTKSNWTPTQRLVHLGLELDTYEGVFRLTGTRRNKVRAAAGALKVEAKGRARTVPAKQLARFLGLAVSCQLAVPASRLYLRSLYDALEQKSHWGSRVRLGRQALKDLCFWEQIAKEGSSAAIWRSPLNAILHCDSSTYGWGGVLNNQLPVRGDWSTREQKLHITLKELMAVRLTVQEFSEHLRGKRIRLHEDNQAVVAVLATYTSRSPEMMRELRLLWQILGYLGAEIRAEYIASEANVWADQLSRVLDPGDYALDPAVFALLEERWGPHTVDRFAAPHNTQLPRFNSLYRCTGTSAVDAFSQDWAGENNYCHPPIHLLPQLVDFLEATKAVATVVVPDWPAQPWWHWLRGLADDEYRIPCGPRSLRPGPNPAVRLPPVRILRAFRFKGE